MDLELTGKRALVTGSTLGIGRAIAVRLGAEGAAVVVHGRDPKRAAAVADSIAAAGGTAAVVLGDLADDAGAQQVAAAAATAFGGIDIVVNNAGGLGPDGWATAESADWATLYNVNVLATVRIVRALLPGMRERGWGRIIQIGSAAHPGPQPARAAYSAAKAAVANLTVGLTKELSGTGITANTVSPGPTRTDGFLAVAAHFADQNGTDLEAATAALLAGPLANPSGRVVEPDEVARLVAFVASPAAASINGANLRIDGGATPTVN